MAKNSYPSRGRNHLRPRSSGSNSTTPSTFRIIETAYKGYRFRSRTEARWAVCFDTLGLSWTYEIEGFDLSGIWYLPDFWVETLNCWIEIKGRIPSQDEIEKAARLHLTSGKRVLIVVGQPWLDEHEVFLFTQNNTVPERELTFGEVNGSLCLVGNDGQRIELHSPHFVRTVGQEFTTDTRFEDSGLHRSFLAARSTRFEHSERELNEALNSLGTLLGLGFGCEHRSPFFKSIDAFFREIGLRPVNYQKHTFALTPGGHDKVGCLIVRDRDRAWSWLEIDWQHFLKKPKNPSDQDQYSPEEWKARELLLARLTRQVRRDPLSFFEKIGIENCIVWRTLTMGLNIRKDGAIELIVLRITDGQWWSVPFDPAMFDRLRNAVPNCADD